MAGRAHYGPMRPNNENREQYQLTVVEARDLPSRLGRRLLQRNRRSRGTAVSCGNEHNTDKR